MYWKQTWWAIFVLPERISSFYLFTKTAPVEGLYKKICNKSLLKSKIDIFTVGEDHESAGHLK